MKYTIFNLLGLCCAALLKRLNMSVALLMLAGPVFAQQVTVDITPGHSTNNFSPLHALGAGIDRDPLNSVHIFYDSGSRCDHALGRVGADQLPTQY